MAAVLLVFAGTVLRERAEKRRKKKESDETRHRELVEKTESRLSRNESGQEIRHHYSGTASDNDVATDQVAPPSYEDVVPSNGAQGVGRTTAEPQGMNRSLLERKRFSFPRKG